MKMTHLFLPLVHPLILRASVASAEDYAPGQASWLGYSGEDSGTPLNYEDYLPYTYVVFALDSVPLIPSIVAIDSECPPTRDCCGRSDADEDEIPRQPGRLQHDAIQISGPYVCEHRAEATNSGRGSSRCPGTPATCVILADGGA